MKNQRTIDRVKAAVTRRLKSYYAKYIPFNTKYRPKKIVNLPLGPSKLNGNREGMEFISLRPPYQSKLDLPDSFVDSCSSYQKPIMISNNPGDYIVSIKNGRVLQDTGSNMAVMTGDGNLVEEVSFQWKDDVLLSGKDNEFYRQKGFTHPTKYKGNVFSLLAGGGAITYYFHWMIDAIPKLFLLKESGLFDQIDYFLVPNYGADAYQKEFLDHFGITEDKIINGFQQRHVQAETLFLTSYVHVNEHYPKWACDGLYTHFVTPNPAKIKNKLIYISRGDGRFRKVFNEPQIIEMLKRYGFEIVSFSKMTMLEKAELLSSASMVVGAHGAGFTNIVFCDAGTKVLEMFPDNYVRHAYYDICNKRGLIYDYLLCESDSNATNALEGQKISLTPDINALEAKVRVMLEITQPQPQEA